MNILIVEDESRIAKRIERMTRDILGNAIQSLTHVNTLHEALKVTENSLLDILLLDLNLNGEDGFDLLTTSVSKSFHTIVISAYKDQAITAYEYGVLDFVPKPFNRDRLEQAFNRAIIKEKTENEGSKTAPKPAVHSSCRGPGADGKPGRLIDREAEYRAAGTARGERRQRGPGFVG